MAGTLPVRVQLPLGYSPCEDPLDLAASFQCVTLDPENGRACASAAEKHGRAYPVLVQLRPGQTNSIEISAERVDWEHPVTLVSLEKDTQLTVLTNDNIFLLFERCVTAKKLKDKMDASMDETFSLKFHCASVPDKLFTPRGHIRFVTLKGQRYFKSIAFAISPENYLLWVKRNAISPPSTRATTSNTDGSGTKRKLSE